MNSGRLLLLACTLVILGESRSTPIELGMSGRLLGANGQPETSSPQDIEFRIYDAEIGGTLLWFDLLSVDVDNGVFQVQLGGMTNPLDQILLPGNTYWLTFLINGGSEQSTRIPMTGQPTVHWSGLADGLPPNSLDGSRIQTGGLDPDKLAACSVGDFIIMGPTGWECQPGI